MLRLKKKWTTLSRSLGFRIALSVGAILVASYLVFTYLIAQIQQDFFFTQMIREAKTFSTAVMNATNHSMLRDDRKATANIVEDLEHGHEISHIRIYNHDGVIKYAGNPVEIGTKVDKEAEACFACHSVDKPFNQVATAKRTRIYHSPEGYRVLGMITPIYNEKQCWTAPCHFHPKNQSVLGVIDVGMPLKEFDSYVKATSLKVMLIGLATVLTVIGTLVAYMILRVNKPVNSLLTWISAMMVGKPAGKSPLTSKDELGELAKAFTILSARMQRRTNELERSREQYRTLFEQVPCFISVIDRNFKIVRQNTKMREFFKGTVGMHCYEVYKKQPEKCDMCAVEDTFLDGRSYMREECGLTVSGEEANYLSYTVPVRDEKGMVPYAMVIAIDIGDRMRLQRELAISLDFQTNLIENSIHGIIATNEKGKLNLFNRAAENLLGYRAEEVIGDGDLGKYFPRRFIEMIVAASRGEPLSESRVVAEEAEIPSRDGERIPVRFSGFLLFDKGQMLGSVGFYQDLRTFKKLEREKLNSDRLAVVGQTVAGLAHGIKNVIQGLEGGLFVVDSAIEDHNQALLDRGWEMVRNNIRRISALTQDLLSYSKERSPEFEKTNPNLLAEEACALFDLRAKEEAITIRRDFDPDIPEIFLDVRGIHTCLSNLISNAIDACEMDSNEGDHVIVVKTLQDVPGGVIFEVSDDGVGMDEETKTKVFSSFFSTKGSKGTGLGLLVTSKIVQEHGGEISFESEPGEGTTFTISLPARTAIESDEAANRQSD